MMYKSNSGEPGAVSPVLLNLKPTMRFSAEGGRLTPIVGCLATLKEAEMIYEALLKVGNSIIEQEKPTNGWVVSSVEIISLGQVVLVNFTFQVCGGKLVLPTPPIAKTLIHRKLRYLFN